MRHEVKLYEDEKLIETFQFAPTSQGSLSEDDYNRIEKEVSEYCEADGLDFWEDNVRMTVNGIEYEKNPRPEPDKPSFEAIPNMPGLVWARW